MKTSIIYILAFICLIKIANAQVAVVPPAIFVDPYTRSAEMFVMNSGNTNKEVTISLLFGYPGLDSLGNTYMEYADSSTEKIHSIANNFAIFPKKFEIAPGKRQTVRFLLRNSGDLQEGLYWARIKTTSKDTDKQLDSSSIDKVNVGVKLAFSMVTVILYQKGKQETELEISSFNTSQDSTSLNMTLGLERAGTAPFLGKTEIKVTNEDGDEIDNTWLITPVYFSGKKKYSFLKEKYPAGKYTANFRFTNDIDDVPAEQRCKFEPVERTFEFEISE